MRIFGLRAILVTTLFLTVTPLSTFLILDSEENRILFVVAVSTAILWHSIAVFNYIKFVDERIIVMHTMGIWKKTEIDLSEIVAVNICSTSVLRGGTIVRIKKKDSQQIAVTMISYKKGLRNLYVELNARNINTTMKLY